MQNIVSRLKDWWTNTPRATRTGLLVGLSGLLVLFIALAFWAATPTYTTLYTGLSPADSAQVVSALKEKGIPVRTTGGGSVVEVPTEHVESARLELASKGLPKTGAPGYARLEKPPFGMTQTMEQNTLRIAMEEELQNTIQHLEPVESARVHITPGNDSPFADSRTEPTASVVVSLKQGMQLTRDQVRGIVHLVSHSVEGLKPENVTVLDSEARPLWNGSDNNVQDQEIVRARREAERGYAEELGRQLQQHLDRVLGKDKSSVVVQAELNLDKQEVQSQRVEPLDPNRAAVISETRSNERLNGNPTPAGGPAGIASNRAETPMYPTAPPTVGTGEYNREDSVRNYEINKQVEHIVRAPGRIERLSVAVLVDESVPENAVTAMRAWLETAVGATPNTPNRVVTVQRVKFDTSTAKAEAEQRQAEESARRMAMLWKMLPVLLLLIVTFFLARVIGKQIKRPVPKLTVGRPVAALPSGGTLDISVGEEGIVDLHSQESESLPTLSARSDTELSLEEEVTRAIRERSQPELIEIQRFAQNKPEHVAALLKNWIKG